MWIYWYYHTPGKQLRLSRISLLYCIYHNFRRERHELMQYCRGIGPEFIERDISFIKCMTEVHVTPLVTGVLHHRYSIQNMLAIFLHFSVWLYHTFLVFAWNPWLVSLGLLFWQRHSHSLISVKQSWRKRVNMLQYIKPIPCQAKAMFITLNIYYTVSLADGIA